MTKILVVDDDEAGRLLLSKILSSAGYEIIQAENGEQALEVFRDQKPDLIITDMNMPVMDGFDLAGTIREDPDSAHVPIIFISAMYKDVESKVRAMDIGGNEYLTQPLDRDELLYKVKAMVRNKALYDELLKSREALKESEQKYRMLFNNATDAIYLLDAHTQQILDCNPKASEVTGYSATELKTMMIADLHPASEQDIVSKIFRKMDKTGKFSDITGIHHLNKRGRLIPIEINATTFTMGCMTYSLGIFRDITERKKAEERLLSEKNKLLRILDTMQDGVYIVSQEHDIEYVNPVLKKTFGMAVGHKCYEYFHRNKKVCPMCKSKEIFAGISVRWEWKSSKNRKVYDIIETPIAGPRGDISKLAILRDITDKKNAEESLARSRAEFEAVINQEKRLYRRFPASDECSARINGSGKIGIKDISSGGICLTAPRLLKPHSIYEIKLLTPSRKEITSSGMVIWSSRHKTKSGAKGPRHYETGFKFIGLHENNRDAFDEFIAGMIRPHRMGKKGKVAGDDAAERADG